MSDRGARHNPGWLVLERDNIVNMLRLRRECFGLSQAALAGQFNVPQQLLGEWERGLVTPNLSSLLRWAKALDCKIEVCAR